MAGLPERNSACVSVFLLSDYPQVADDMRAYITEPAISLSVTSFNETNFPIALILQSDLVVAYVDDCSLEPVLQRLQAFRADGRGLNFVIVDQAATPERAVLVMKAGGSDYLCCGQSGMSEIAAKIEQICLDTLFSIPAIPATARDNAPTENLKNVHRKIRKVVQAAKFLATSSSLQDICEGLLEKIGDALDATGGSLYLVNGDHLEQVHALDPGHAPMRLPLPLEKGSLFEQVYSSGEPLLITEQAPIPINKSSGWAGYEGESVLIYPLVERSGALIGLFSLHGKKNNTFTREDRDLVLILASYSHETIRSLLAQERSRKAFDSLQLTFENMNEGILLLDQDNTIVQFNRNVSSIIGLDAEVLSVGQDIAELYELLFKRGDLGDKLQGRCPWVEVRGDYEYLHFCADGTIVKVFGNALESGGYVLTLTDITSQKNWESELFQAKEKAEAANISKTNFLANVSHELRTPLNAIIGFSEMMTSEVFGAIGNDRYAEYVRHIQDSGTHLLRLINNLLDLSKVEAGKFELHMGKVELAELVQNTSTYFEHQAKEAGVELIISEISDIGSIWADENALRQISLNLISNAIKFTPKGGHVTVSVEKNEAGEVKIAVTDTGIGMAKPSLDIALQPFGQIENAFNRKYPGTGLGLPLVVSLSELHGGRFEIDSALGQGTTCNVYLPSISTTRH